MTCSSAPFISILTESPFANSSAIQKLKSKIQPSKLCDTMEPRTDLEAGDWSLEGHFVCNFAINYTPSLLMNVSHFWIRVGQEVLVHWVGIRKRKSNRYHSGNRTSVGSQAVLAESGLPNNALAKISLVIHYLKLCHRSIIRTWVTGNDHAADSKAQDG